MSGVQFSTLQSFLAYPAKQRHTYLNLLAKPRNHVSTPGALCVSLPTSPALRVRSPNVISGQLCTAGMSALSCRRRYSDGPRDAMGSQVVSERPAAGALAHRLHAPNNFPRLAGAHTSLVGGCEVTGGAFRKFTAWKAIAMLPRLFLACHARCRV
jgi:hypothetical protein